MTKLIYITKIKSRLTEAEANELSDKLGGTVKYYISQIPINYCGPELHPPISYLNVPKNIKIDDAEYENTDLKIFEVPEKTLIFPKKIFNINNLDFSLSEFRVGKCTPTYGQVNKTNFVIYHYETEEEMEKIIKAIRKFFNNRDFQYFNGLAISPQNEYIQEYAKKIINAFKVKGKVSKNIKNIHLTSGMFSIDDEDELKEVINIVKEVISKIDWPADTRIEFPRISFFGGIENARAIYAEPVGPLVDAIYRYGELLKETMLDHGMPYFQRVTVLHATLILGHTSARNAMTVIGGQSDVNAVEQMLATAERMRAAAQFAEGVKEGACGDAEAVAASCGALCGGLFALEGAVSSLKRLSKPPEENFEYALPPVERTEFRFVQRRVPKDDDGFYHLIEKLKEF